MSGSFDLAILILENYLSDILSLQILIFAIAKVWRQHCIRKLSPGQGGRGCKLRATLAAVRGTHVAGRQSRKRKMAPVMFFQYSVEVISSRRIHFTKQETHYCLYYLNFYLVCMHVYDTETESEHIQECHVTCREQRTMSRSHYEGSGEWTQVVSLGSKLLYSLSHLLAQNFGIK